MRIVATTTEALDERTRAAIIRVCILAHGETSFERLFEHVPSGGRHFLACEGRRIVGHAMVTTRWLHVPAGRRLRTAYVDAVATHPAYQGRGYGSALMRRLASDIADYDIACLETDRPGFYERLGWQVWRGSLAGVRGTEVLPTPDQRGIMVLRLERSRDVDLDGPLVIEWQGRIW